MRKTFLILLIVSVSIKSFAQKDNTSLIAKISLQVIDNKYLLFDAVIANDTLVFYFDTGAATSLIDTNSAKRLGIKANHEQTIQGAGGTKAYRVATGQKLSINTIELDNVNLVFEDLTRLKEALKAPFDGIIGYSLINEYVTEIDYLQKEIRLYSDTSNFNLSEYSEHNFSFSNGIPIPQFEIEIVLNNDEVLKGEILFDSGAGLNLLMNTPFKEQHKIVEKSESIKTVATNNLSKTSNSQQVLIKSLNMGNYRFENLQIGLSADTSGVSAMDNYLGILGAEIIKYFDVILDYSKQTLYMKPNELYNTKNN